MLETIACILGSVKDEEISSPCNVREEVQHTLHHITMCWFIITLYATLQSSSFSPLVPTIKSNNTGFSVSVEILNIDITCNYTAFACKLHCVLLCTYNNIFWCSLQACHADFCLGHMCVTPSSKCHTCLASVVFRRVSEPRGESAVSNYNSNVKTELSCRSNFASCCAHCKCVSKRMQAWGDTGQTFLIYCRVSGLRMLS